MLKYNTSEKKLILPEYGRNMQKLVDYCLSIEDREERNRCAYAIADIMSRLFPDQSGKKGDNRKVWDHINIMAEFKLDIDFPCEVLAAENLNPTPATIPYNVLSDKYRHYGKNIVEMIRNVGDMENGIEKDKIIFLLANQMKKLLVSENPENASDARVFKDIKEISKGKIAIDADHYRLNEYIGVAEQPEGKKKKKK